MGLLGPVGSHEASEAERMRWSSRSRSPHVCEQRAREESATLDRIIWDEHVPSLDPRQEDVLKLAESIIDRYFSDFRISGDALPNDCFYVGVTRYLRRRWLGDDLDLPPEHAHGNNWQVMYILATYSEGIGKIEDFLIHCLRLRFGRLACANIRQGGGGTDRRKPSMLYLCLR